MEKCNFEKVMRYLKEKMRDVYSCEEITKIAIKFIEEDRLSLAIQILKTLESDSTFAEYYFFQADSMMAESPQPITTREDVEKLIKKVANKGEWIPTNFGYYPQNDEKVQITYLGCIDGKPHCDEIAYRIGDEWRWGDDGERANVQITAWRYMGEPYKEED